MSPLSKGGFTMKGIDQAAVMFYIVVLVYCLLWLTCRVSS